jgi:hypothetical protein
LYELVDAIAFGIHEEIAAQTVGGRRSGSAAGWRWSSSAPFRSDTAKLASASKTNVRLRATRYATAETLATRPAESCARSAGIYSAAAATEN